MMTNTAEAIALDLKRCPRCEESLPTSEFGVCRARKDGLNLYCRSCIREKISLSRKALREYKDARRKHAAPDKAKSEEAKPLLTPRRIARKMKKLQPGDRVREAIRCGARTQKEIVKLTRLPKDEVCDALANLLLWSREIRTQVVRHQRMYFLNEPLEQKKELGNKAKRGLASSFSSVGMLMPGRKPSAKGRKRVTAPPASSKTRIKGV